MGNAVSPGRAPLCHVIVALSEGADNVMAFSDQSRGSASDNPATLNFAAGAGVLISAPPVGAP
jgi:hypothetical protein